MSNDPKMAERLVPRFLLDGGKETAGETDYCVILVKLPKNGTHQELHHVNSLFFRMCLLCELVTQQNIYDSGPKITTWKKKSQAADAIFVPHARNRKMKNSSLDNACTSILFPAFLIICINLRHVSISCSTAASYIQRINLKTKGLLKTLIYTSEINPSSKKSRCISPSHVTRMEEHDSSEPSNDNTNVANALQEPFVVEQDPGKNSSQSPPQINHHCCYGCGNPLEDIFCHQCTCELCGNGAHFGYNCSPKVSIVLDPKPFNNQTVDELPQTLPSFNPTCYFEDGNSFTYDSKSNLVHDSPNVFDPPLQPPLYSCEFCGNDARYGHYCTPQVPFIYPKPCYNQDFNFPQDFHDFQQQYLYCENCGVTHEAYQCQPMNEDYYHEQNSFYDPSSFGFDQFQPPQYTINHLIFNAQNDLFNSQNKLMEQLTSMCDMIPACCYYDDDDDYTIAITHKEPDNSLSMRDEHLDTIPAMESDEFIKPSAKNLVPNPSESEDEYECDVPTYEVFTTFSNILFDADYDFSSSDDQSFYNEYIPKKIYSNPLFDEEIISMKIDPYHFNAESDLIESLLNRDSSIISSSSKIDSLFDEFAGELTIFKSIPPGINKTDCDPEEETRFIKRLLYDKSSPHPPEEFISKNSDTAFESFSPFPIPVEDSGSLMEEIDLSFTPDYPMSLGIKEDDYDSEGDILILEELLNSDSLSLPENESFHFDIPSFSRPPTKPPDGNTRILNVKVMGDISEHKVPLPRLKPTLVPNQKKSLNLLSHQGHEAFQPFTECPMMIYGKNTPILDVPFFHFYPP
uniref:Uncharacterized protein n=1 Tax=Tanacetum cinerariifolium TaxID=118510 RepID=A0A6L2LL64_TANCI|nr:hypothetical protein [Tanacetum cinerariifolium]